MKKKTILRIVLAVLAAALIGGCLYLNSLLPIITGYAAKNLASDVFVSGREPADVEALDLHFSFIKFTRNKVDFENKTVTSRFLWGKSVAAYRDGYGVTLLRGKKAAALQAEKYPLAPETEGPDCLVPGDSALTVRLAPIAKALVDDHAYNGTPFAFVVLHEGKVVAERYREGITARTRLLSWSMAKSFTNALVGIMSGDGMVDIYAPTGIPEWQGDERATITLNDLMQMQSGALDKPLEHKPGTFWYYSSGSTNIVMRYLRGKFASDKEFLTYYRERLFAPLGIHNPVFEPDMSGTPVGSSYLYITAREFASLGQLYLDDGVFQGQRILPEGWVDYTVTPASDSKDGYGSFFWLNKDKFWPDIPEDMFNCQGHDGQEIFIIPSKDLVVVVLGYSPKPDRVVDWNALVRDIIGQL